MKKPKLSTLITLLGIYTFIFSVSSCSSGNNEEVNNSKIPSIDLVEAYNNRMEVPLSVFAESVEYVPLETIEESLVASDPIFQVSDKNIIISAKNQVLVFDKTSGEFVSEIGTYGEGPDEYKYVDKYFNESTGYTYVRSSKEHYVLNNEGAIVERFKTPLDDSVFVSNYIHLNDSLFVGFHGNYNCNQKYRLVFFDNEGDIIKLIENQATCEIEDPNSFHFFGNEGTFSTYQGESFFKETYNDTLFKIRDMDLVPVAVFHAGNRGIPYEQRVTMSSSETRNEAFLTKFIDITRQSVLFQLITQSQTFNGVFNRETGETLLSDIGRTEMHGFVNDLDNFLPFVPQYATNNNQLVGYIEAPDVLAWFKENPEKAAQLPDNLKKLGDIKSDDNPVVMIVDLKD